MEQREGRSVYGDWRTAAPNESGLLRSEFKWLLRPTTPYEMLDDSIALYREYFPPLFKLSFLIFLFPIVLTILFLIPITIIEVRFSTATITSALLTFGLTVLILPYLAIASPLQAMTSAYLAYRFLQGQPVRSLREMWQAVRPRLWTLIWNQFLVMFLLGVAHATLGIVFLIAMVSALVGIALWNLGSAASLLLTMMFMLGLVIAWIVTSALITMWVIVLPQIILFEPQVDALTAIARAIALVRPNFRHVFLSCILFWAFQGVLYLSAYMCLILVVSVMAMVMHAYGVDIANTYLRFANTFGNLVDVVSYVVFVFVMPPVYLSSFFLYFDLRYRTEGLDIAQVLTHGGRG